jgi:Flp pilus assembly protein TadD
MTIYGNNETKNDGTNGTGGPSAPFRTLGGREKKTSPLLAILLVLAAAGGGYYLISSGDPEAPPVVIDTAAVAPSPEAETAALVADPATSSAIADPSAAPAPETPQVATEGDSVVPMSETVVSPIEPLLPATSTTAAETAAPEAAATDTAAAAPSATGDIPVVEAQDEMPPKDLPVPAEAASSETTPPAEAEVAIVQNAAMLDQLSAPAGAVTEAEPALPTVNAPAIDQDALIRPLPKEYLIVKKNHDGGDVDSRLTAARLALVQGRNNAALQLFNEMYRDYPRDSRIAMGRAVSLQKLGQTGEALTAYQSVLENEPSNLEALTNMLGLLKKENPALAVEKLAELRSAYPYNADIAAQLGIAYAGQGSYAEAEKYLDMADALKPGSAYVLYNKAVLYDKAGRSGEAAALYRQIVRLAAEGSLDQQLPLEAIKRRLSTIR